MTLRRVTLCACGKPTCPDPTGTFGAAFADRFCAACWRLQWEGFERMQAEYRELVAAGVHPSIASRRISCALQKREGKSPK